MNCKHLPKGYEPVKKIDLLSNHKEMVAVNLISFALMVIMILIGGAVTGIDKLRSMLLVDSTQELKHFVLKLVLTLTFCAVYIVLHELVHGVFMKLCLKGCKVNFGYKVIYAYAGSNACFSRISYVIIAAAPLVFFGVLLSIICCVVPAEWFWPIYLVQVLNVSGAAGDIYVFFLILRMPKDILIRDTGISMTVYGKCD